MVVFWLLACFDSVPKQEDTSSSQDTTVEDTTDTTDITDTTDTTDTQDTTDTSDSGTHNTDSADTGMSTREPFACGDLQCQGNQYCSHWIGGVPDTAGNAIHSYSCVDVAPECPNVPDCACLFTAELCMPYDECVENSSFLGCTTYAP